MKAISFKVLMFLAVGFLVIQCSNPVSETSEITCPHCGHSKVEELPTDRCVIFYTCENCNEELSPKEGDCCVFCTYGTHKCPSMQ